MRNQLLMGAGVALACVLAIGIGEQPRASAAVQPERSLAGIGLGRSYLDVLNLYGGPNEIRTVVTPGGSPGEGGGFPGLPGAGGGTGGTGGGFPGMSSGGGFPGLQGMGSGGDPALQGGGGGGPGFATGGGMSGAFPGLKGGGGPGAFGGPTAFGGSGSSGGAFGPPVGGSGGPVLPPAGGMGFPGGGTDASPAMTGGGESSALLWVYNKANVRLEFLINEDGRVAQISVAAPAKNVPQSISSRRGQIPIQTARQIMLGSNYATVINKYGFPEKTRVTQGGRFDEAYYTRNYHAAFSFDATSAGRKVVRITITLAD